METTGLEWVFVTVCIVFSITLILTKSKILAGKREFVEQRFQASKVANQKPGFVHSVWHAIFTCPMCSGFWIALILCWIYPKYGLFRDVMIIFGLNWIFHCVESFLFFNSENAENKVNLTEISQKEEKSEDFS